MTSAVDLKELFAAFNGRDNTFTEDQIPIKEPYHQFKLWYDEACQRKDIDDPKVMCLSTASKDGLPSGRMVLLKAFGKKDGFTFFTTLASRKGNDLKENPRAALTFYWAAVKRMIRVEGDVKQLSEEETRTCFFTRPYPSQIAAMVSDQGGAIPSREYLCQRAEALQKDYPDGSRVKKPNDWVGITVIPSSLEFWQGQDDRLHDRIRFRRLKDGEEVDGVLLHQGEDGWVYERLLP